MLACISDSCSFSSLPSNAPAIALLDKVHFPTLRGHSAESLVEELQDVFASSEQFSYQSPLT